MWLMAEDFSERVQRWLRSYVVDGSPSFVLASKLRMLKGDLKLGNASKFGHVATQKTAM